MSSDSSLSSSSVASDACSAATDEILANAKLIPWILAIVILLAFGSCVTCAMGVWGSHRQHRKLHYDDDNSRPSGDRSPLRDSNDSSDS